MRSPYVSLAEMLQLTYTYFIFMDNDVHHHFSSENTKRQEEVQIF